MALREKNVSETVKALISPVCGEFGYMLWDVEFVKEGARRVLRITIDSENGIGIEDCEKLHRAVDPILDEADPIEEAYFLEVSSPGIEREIKTPEHFAYYKGRDVEIKLYSPIDGNKLFRGVLEGILPDGSVEIKQKDGSSLVFEKGKVAKVGSYFDF